MALAFVISSEGACACADNRLRVWDRLVGVDGPPDREIVHSHDFNRYLTVRPCALSQQSCSSSGPCVTPFFL